ncbi:MAG TPA: hypothetical protein VF765_32825 [Polyangiaceae bacterium]
MKSGDRMFRVLVLGGIALTACGGATTTPGNGTDSGSDGFPQEGPAQVDAFPSETAQQVDAFVPFDAGQDAGQDTGSDVFPTEGPAMIDSGSTDVGQDVPCFPAETALADAGCITPQGD